MLPKHPLTSKAETNLQKRRGDSGFLVTTGNPDFLFLFFILPQIFSQEYINLLLSMYFFVLGILALSHTIRSEGTSAAFEAAFSGASKGSWIS
jgi:hypothetical protein